MSKPYDYIKIETIPTRKAGTIRRALGELAIFSAWCAVLIGWLVVLGAMVNQ